MEVVKKKKTIHLKCCGSRLEHGGRKKSATAGRCMGLPVAAESGEWIGFGVDFESGASLYLSTEILGTEGMNR